MKTYAIDNKGRKIRVDIIEPHKNLMEEVARIEKREKQWKLFKARLPRLILSTIFTTIWQLSKTFVSLLFIAAIISLVTGLFGVEMEAGFFQNGCLLALFFTSSQYIDNIVNEPLFKIKKTEARNLRRLIGGILWVAGISYILTTAVLYFVNVDATKMFLLIFAFELIRFNKSIIEIKKNQKM